MIAVYHNMKTSRQFLAVITLICFIVLADYTCGQSNQKEYKTNTGKLFYIAEKHPNGQSLSTIEIESSGFEYNLDEIIEDSDPIKEIVVTDLDNNGFDELYIITVSSGSGSYGSVLAFASNRDISLSMITFPKIQNGDSLFKGYMGHDSFSVINQKLLRVFPLYLPTDKQNDPTGGMRTLTYGLHKGEAVWQLQIEKAIEIK
jgi:hypothetical protein